MFKAVFSGIDASWLDTKSSPDTWSQVYNCAANIIYYQLNDSVYFTFIYLESGDSQEQYSESKLLLMLECQSEELASLQTVYRALLAKEKFETFQSTRAGLNNIIILITNHCAYHNCIPLFNMMFI